MSPREPAVLQAFLFLHAAISGVWLVYAFAPSTAPPERDWFVLREVAVAFVHGDFGSLYIVRQIPDGWMFFQYPPFVLYALAPLALVPPMVAYAGICVTQLVATAIA